MRSFFCCAGDLFSLASVANDIVFAAATRAVAGTAATLFALFTIADHQRDGKDDEKCDDDDGDDLPRFHSVNLRKRR